MAERGAGVRPVTRLAAYGSATRTVSVQPSPGRGGRRACGSADEGGVGIRHTGGSRLSDRWNLEVPLRFAGAGGGGTSRCHVWSVATILGWRAAC